MEEHVSDFRVRGSWDEVVAYGERIARALRESDVDEDALAGWDDWQPKAHEDLGEEVSERTVEKASLEQGAGERAGQAATEDLERASTLSNVGTMQSTRPLGRPSTRSKQRSTSE